MNISIVIKEKGFKLKKKFNVVLVLKNGGRYSFRDAILLADQIRKRSFGKVAIYCLSDVVKRPMELADVNFIPFKNPEWTGYWSKMNLFNPVYAYLRPFLYFDLDTLVLHEYSKLLPKDRNNFVTLEDFWQKGKLATGLMWFPEKNQKLEKIWNSWKIKPLETIKKFWGDQDFIRTIVEADKYFQDYTDKVGSFKPEPARQPLTEKPKGKSVICLHGKPGIQEVLTNYKWVKNILKEDRICQEKTI